MPSVTEVLDYLTEPELLRWFRNNSKKKCDTIGEETRLIGIEVDGLIKEEILPKGLIPPSQDQKIMNCMNAWCLFKKDHPEFVPGVKYMQRELSLDGVKGHPDFECIRKVGWGISDLKCSNAIRPKNFTQIAKYADLKMRLFKLNFPAFIEIIRLDRRTGLYEYRCVTDPEYIRYEIEVFDARYVAFRHAFNNREFLRQALENEKD